MWTPRRLVVFLVFTVGFVGAYLLYAQVLGRIDGLPQLPLEFYARRSANDADLPPVLKNTQIDTKLQRAFGSGCVEVSYNHRLELQKNGVILATNQLTIEPDGRCKLKPFSIAVMKERGPNLEPEISTVHSDEAYLLFDEPVKNLAEMGKRKIVGCDLNSDPTLLSPDPRRHRIICQNNRSTPDQNDDLIIETVGPVKYRDAATTGPISDRGPAQIQTTAAVRLTDRRGQPKSTTITADGMKILLAGASPIQPAGKAKAKTGSVTGVQKVILPDNVTMNLWIDPQGGFLASAKNDAPTPQAEAERSNVQITTAGSFTYEIGAETDLARFDMKPAVTPTEKPGLVQVIRPMTKNDVVVYDRLDCETLEMQFAHAKGGTEKDKTSSGSNLQWVRARGQFVVLTSQADNMQAHGQELFHDALTKQSTLRGTPEVVALKDGHEIHAQELVLVNADKSGQEAIARGRGYFKGQVNGEQGNGNEARQLTARWRDKLHYRKDDGHDVITLIGAATVEDPEKQQSLSGDQIRLTLAPTTGQAPPTNPGSAPRAKPRRLEVTGHVAAQSSELQIKDTDQLVVLFKDGVPRVRPNAEGNRKPEGVIPIPANPAGANTADAPIVPNAPAAPAAPPKPPLVLTAKSVQAFMIAAESGPTELEIVNCEGAVVVHQDPTPPQEKPVDMRGDTLQLTRLNIGHKLEITGDPDRPAEVHLPDLSLLGPTIIINQDQNDAEVKGPGTMRLTTNTDFQGNKLTKPSDLLVSWRQEMYFNGLIARFQGHIQASQDNTRLLCHGMEVTLDQEVKLNQAASEKKANAKSATVAKVICETNGTDGAQPVSVVDSVYEMKDGERKMVRYQRIESRELLLFKLEGKIEAPGPGEVRILQMGPKDQAGPIGPTNKAKNKGPELPKPPEEEMKLTWVRYDFKLTAVNDTQVATFWKNVEVLHLPADSPQLHQNLDQIINKLPPRALYLKCEMLQVFSQTRNGTAKKNHILEAKGRASCQFDSYFAEGDAIKYDEEKQQLIIQGTKDQPAVVTKMNAVGQQPQVSRGVKFTYDRLTGRFVGQDVTSIRGN